MVTIRTTEGGKLEAALRPEASRPLPRTKISMRLADGDLLLEVRARDTSSLRAALNSYLRWASTALEVMKEAVR